MRWISYFILAYLIIAVQMALAGYLRWGQASPNLVLPAAVFIAINARREHALERIHGIGVRVVVGLVDAVAALWRATRPVDTDAPVSHRYAALHHALRLKGRPIPTNDLWIAAIAMEHGLVLYTRDAHFEAVPGLALV